MTQKRHSHRPLLLVGFCLLLGVIVTVSYYKHRYQTVEKEISFVLDWREKPSDMSLMSEVPDQLKVKIKGYGFVLEPFVKKEHVYLIDFTNVETGTVYMPIDATRFQFPEDVEIIDITPNQLTFRIERIIERELPVRLSVSGTPAETCVLSEIYLKPGLVIFNGPEAILKDTQEFFTRELSIEGVHESFSKELPLVMDESFTPYVSSRIVRVDVTLNEKIQLQVFKNIHVRGKNTQFRYKIRPSTVDLTFEGKMKALKELSPKTINVYIDLTGLKRGVYARRVKIEVPGNVSLTGARPEIFTITLY